jgi:uncharacterized glyoxalase superfamily protein PhnB
MNKIPIMILYVADQVRSKEFYKKIFQAEPVLDVDGMTEFKVNDNFKLGIMPEKNIAKLLFPKTKHPQLGQGIPRCELYLIVADPAAALKRAVDAGALEVSKAEMRDWNDVVGYCCDLDGHIIAFAS